MNILICDDIKKEADKIAELFHDLGFKPVVFYNGYDALDCIHAGAVVDVCFIDIIMPEMSGIVLADKLRSGGFSGDIIFLTVSNEYAHESYQVNAFSYLIKPPTKEILASVLDKIKNARREIDTEGILVNTKSITRFIKFQELSHIEVIGRNVYFRLTGGAEVKMYSTFREIVPQLLGDARFVQCHRSFVVNMNEIDFITDREITMQNGGRIPISRSYPETKSVYFKWKFGGKRK